MIEWKNINENPPHDGEICLFRENLSGGMKNPEYGYYIAMYAKDRNFVWVSMNNQSVELPVKYLEWARLT